MEGLTMRSTSRNTESRSRILSVCRSRRIPLLLATLALIMGSPLVVAASSTDGSSLALVSTALADGSSSTMAASAPPTTKKKKNVVVQLAVYVKNSVVRTVDSCGQLWTNHGKCKEIRKSQAKYRDQVAHQWELDGMYTTETPRAINRRLASVQGGISYADYVFLQKGKEDRGKLLNLLFLMWGAPRFLPYALMFNPEMLPSPFTASHDNNNPTTNHNSGQGGGGLMRSETPMQRASRERSAAIIQALADLERQVVAGGGGGFLSKLNVFGSNKRTDQHQRVVQVYDATKQRLAAGNNDDDGTSTNMTDTLHPVVFRDTEFTRSEQRLCHVPACLVQGMGRAIAGNAAGSFLSHLTPHFLHRNKVVAHLQKVANADDFLVQAGIALNSIPPRLLQEACRDRMLGGPDWDVSELQAGLQEWLRVTALEPAHHLAGAARPLYYNGNVMRMALMGFYACQGARGVGRVEPTLPQLLLGTQLPSSATTTKIEDKKSPVKGTGAKLLPVNGDATSSKKAESRGFFSRKGRKKAN